MTVPIEYPQRLRSPDEARALYGGLGDTRVALRGFRTSEPARIERLVAAVEPGFETTVNFDTGLLDSRGWSRLEALATAGPDYLDVHAGHANLRLWPAQAKVYARLPADGIIGVSMAFGEPLRSGENRFGDTTIMIDPVVGYPLAVALTSSDRAVALRMFRALGDANVSRGYLMRPNEPAKSLLAPFLHGLRATVHVALDMQLELAAELATGCSDLRHEWGSVIGAVGWSGVAVDFPGGRIHGYLPNGEDRERWLERIRHALP